MAGDVRSAGQGQKTAGSPEDGMGWTAAQGPSVAPASNDRAWLRSPSDALVVAGWISFLLGVTVLTGWHVGLAAIVEIVPGQAPMAYLSALAFLSVGLGLVWPEGRHCGRAKLIGGVMAVAIAGTSLLSAAIDLNFQRIIAAGSLSSHAITRPEAPACCLALLGVAVGLVGLAPNRPRVQAMVAIIAALAFAVGLQSWIALAIGLDHADYTARLSLSDIAPHTALGLVVVSAGLFLWAWQQGAAAGQPIPAWAPWPVGATVAAVTLFLALAIDADERAIARGEMRADLTTVQKVIETQSIARDKAIERILARQTEGAYTDLEHWRADARRYLSDFPGLIVLALYQGAGAAKAVVSEKTLLGQNEQAIVAELAWARENASTMLHSNTTAVDFPLHASVGNLPHVHGIYVCQRNDQGEIVELVSLIHVPRMLEAIIPEAISRRYRIRITRGTTVLHESRPQFPVATRIEPVAGWVDFVGNRWRLTLQPSNQAIGALETSLPEITGVIGVLLAISLALSVGQSHNLARQAAGLSLLESEKQMLLDTAGDGICGLDTTGRITFANPTACELTGWQSRELLGQDFHDLICHSYGDGIPYHIKDSPITRCLSTAATVRSEEEEFWRKDGQAIPVEISVTAMVYRGEVKGAVIVFSNITQRKQTENALIREQEHLESLVGARTTELTQANQALTREVEERRATETALVESEARWRRIVMEAPFPIMVHTEDGEVQLVSRSWTEITGYSAADIPTIRDWTSRAYGDKADAMAGYIENLFQPERGNQNSEFEILTSTGKRRIWDFYTALIGQLPDGRRLIISMAADVTERREAERAVSALNTELEARVRQRTLDLETANEELKSFAYSVSHDLRAPLRAMSGFGRALLEDYADKLDETARSYIERIDAASGRMALLIDGLLALSRVTRQPLQRTRVDLSEIAARIVAELRSDAPDRQVEVEIQPGMIAFADEAMMVSALTNLLANAWKFTEPKPSARISFQASEVDGRLVYAVRDTGIGFDMQYVDKIFDTFQRLHNDKAFEGTGIGLATVARIIHRHRGEVWAEGVVGDGASIYFTLGETENDPTDTEDNRSNA